MYETNFLWTPPIARDKMCKYHFKNLYIGVDECDYETNIYINELFLHKTQRIYISYSIKDS